MSNPYSVGQQVRASDHPDFGEVPSSLGKDGDVFTVTVVKSEYHVRLDGVESLVHIGWLRPAEVEIRPARFNIGDRVVVTDKRTRVGWEETGEYLQYVQPSVGALLADLMDAHPNLPEVQAIAAEMKRINDRRAHRRRESGPSARKGAVMTSAHAGESAAILAARLLRDSADDCEVVGFTGVGRCVEPAVAARIDGEFVDLVCTEHADRARARGASVVLPPGKEQS